MAAERIIGVDFGTSTSVIRVKRYENGAPIGEHLETKEVIFGSNGAMVPTLVMCKDDDPSVCYFGFEAQQKKKKFSNYHGFKMDLESSDPEKQALAKSLTQDFYAFLAKQYKSQSEGGHLGSFEDKERTIISYPVKWSEETKQFMLETAKKAGFPNVTGMDEAQAAIQAVIVMSTDYLKDHGLLQKDVGVNVLLIDMGAGTTDLVLAHYVPGDQPKTQVLSTWPAGGSLQFGGREVDSLLQSYFQGLLDEEDQDTVEKIFRRVGTDKFKSWKEETVSPALSKNDSVCDFAALDERLEDEDIELEYCLDRQAFEDCLKNYLRQFPELVNGCLQNGGMDGSDVDLVIVTGGHSQWYFIRDMLTGNLSRFGDVTLPKIQQEPNRIIPISRPQETVALGLAYSGIHVALSVCGAEPEKGQEEASSEDEQTCSPITDFAPDSAAEQPEPQASPAEEPLCAEDAVIRFFEEYPQEALRKFSAPAQSSEGELRRRLLVPPYEQALVVKDCAWIFSGSCGTIITPRGIYLRGDFLDPTFTDWSEFIAGELFLKDSSHIHLRVPGSAQSKDVGYFLSCASVAFECYLALQKNLRSADCPIESAQQRGTISNAPGSCIYTIHPGQSIHDAAKEVEAFFSARSMETHRLDSSGSCLVQARAIGGQWHQFLGLDKAITVRFTPVGENQVSVEIGGGKWMDKAIGAAVSMVVLWPLLITSGMGAVEQAKLLQDAKKVIENYFYG